MLPVNRGSARMASHWYVWKNRILLVASLLALALLWYPVQFALAFDPYSDAVRTDAGWLGPTPRDPGDCVLDMGKVNVWTCEDTTIFREHRLGCDLWLGFFDYRDEPRR
jgi:hypothetical protein